MKKKLGYIFLGIAILLALLYFLRYKQALDFEQKIPNAATSVVHINARQVEHHMLIDALKNPLKYIDFKFSTKKKDSLRLKNLVRIPKNFFFFTNNTTFKKGWFSSFLSVKNNVKLAQYLLREGFVQTNDTSVSIFKKEKFFFALKDKRLLIAYNITDQEIEVTAFKSIFNEVSFLSEESELLKPIVNSQSDIGYTTATKDFVEVYFKDGLLEVTGIFDSKAFLKTKHPATSKSSIAYLHTRIDKEHRLFRSLFTKRTKDKFNEFTKLSIDSIANSWSGGLTFNLKSIRHKTDTIVTYDYDDDFNKIEKRSVQQLTVPDLDFSLASTQHLFEYLSRKNAIQVIDNDTIFTTIPLYRLYGHQSPGAFEISTANVFGRSSVKNDAYKMKAYFNVEAYLQNPLEFGFLPSNNVYAVLLKETSIELTENNELSIDVRLKNEGRNFVGQFVKP